MSRIIAIVNQKGGVGKTTSTINIGSALVRSGKRVLLVDADAQGSLSISAGMDEQTLETGLTTAEVLLENVSIADAIRVNVCSGFDLLPADIRLSAADLRLVNVPGRELILRDALEEVEQAYDYILIDCPPNLSLTALNALAAAHELIIPVQAHFLAVGGLSLLLDTIKLMKRLNPNLKIAGVLLTMYDGRTNHAKEISAQVKEFFGDKVFNTVIRANISLADAPAQGMDIFQYAPRSNGSADYTALCVEIVNQEGNQ